MSQPHHFVFNELERVIRNSVPNNDKLLGLLIEKKVLREVDKGKFTGKNGMKCLTSYMRIKNFETFVTFLECIRDASELDHSVDSSILETVRGAVKTFDENHGTNYEIQVPHLQKSVTEMAESTVDQLPESVGSMAAQVICKNTSVMTVDDELELIQLVSSPMEIRVGSEGGKLCSYLNDYEIIIPPNAIANYATVRAATCAYDRFDFSNDVYRISDFVCVSTDAQFRLPVTVRLAHCLRLPEYNNTPAIAVMHADLANRKESGEFLFSLLDSSTEISTTHPFISIQVQTFCIFCAVYCQWKYRGFQKSTDQCSGKQVSKASKKKSKNIVSPYDRPIIPHLDYVLLFFEPKEQKSPFRVEVFACLDCPGSIELCKMLKKKEGLWKKAESRNFDFNPSKVIFMDVTEVVSHEWEIGFKAKCIHEYDIQRPDITNIKGKRKDLKYATNLIADSDGDPSYPPRMAMEATAISPDASCLKLSITIKDGKDGESVIDDPFEVVSLPTPISYTAKEIGHGIGRTVIDNKQVGDPSVRIIKRSLSAEEEECLEKTVTYDSIVRMCQYIKNWKLVARQLSISEVKITHIEQECMCHHEKMEERAYQMMHHWSRSSETSTYRTLVEALKNCEENEAVNNVLENIVSLSCS